MCCRVCMCVLTAPSPLSDPYRNGTLLCELARKFLARLLPSSGAGAAGEAAADAAGDAVALAKSLVPIRRHPLVLSAVLENCIRGLLGLRRALRARQHRWDEAAAAADPSALPVAPASHNNSVPFATMLLSLSPRLEALVDAVVKGDRDALWGLLAYLHAEWSLTRAADADHQRPQQQLAVSPSNNTAAATAAACASWTPVEVSLLQWMQALGVGVGLGVSEDHVGGGFSGPLSQQPEAAVAVAVGPQLHVLPPLPQIGVQQLMSLMRKGVLLCELVLATAPASPAAAAAAPSDGSQEALRLLRASMSRDPRSWVVCRSNLSKALSALEARRAFSMHLLRAHRDRTLDALAQGHRATTMQLLYDIYACHSGLPPHHSDKLCMGRHLIGGGSGSGTSGSGNNGTSTSGAQAIRAQVDSHIAAMAPSSPSPQQAASLVSSPRTIDSTISELPKPTTTTTAVEEEAEAKTATTTTMTTAAEEKKTARPSSFHQAATSAGPGLHVVAAHGWDEKQELLSSTAALHSGVVVVGAESASSGPHSVQQQPRPLQEALLLFGWLRDLRLKAVTDRVGAACALLHPDEWRYFSPEQRAQVGLAAGGWDDGPVEQQLSAAFRDGELLCALVSHLLHKPLVGVVVSRDSSRSGSGSGSGSAGSAVSRSPSASGSRRAVWLHNVELALESLRLDHRRMPLTYLYREAAHAVVKQDQKVLRALLMDIRAAFPASQKKTRK